MNSSVTVVIPAYNAEAWVGDAIRSALNQTCPPGEIIVVDDGSSDATASRAAEYPVRVIRQSNAGPGAARTTGIRASSGEWIALLDADDCWLPSKLERQLPLLSLAALGILSAAAAQPGGWIGL